MVKVLFICLGNICRSPAAHGVFEHFVEQEGLTDNIFVDSAGTSGFHRGEMADARMIEHAARRGYDLRSLSRKLVAKDYQEFDYLIVMDDSNHKNTLALAKDESDIDKVFKMVDFCPSFSDKEVPDPYYGGEAGFEHVLDLVEEGSRNLLQKIKSENNL
ncbi:MAG: low molecular weight phosphotyrosine protein phosphatase [Oligoflexia bacterium]|nr:low molecular weight phosphotyrosine protein phosphatase [Oligoflexia bacterium]